MQAPPVSVAVLPRPLRVLGVIGVLCMHGIDGFDGTG